ncbi:MAG: PEP-CTERM sorting domain-containing protein [Sandaracinobacter sp.]
MKQLCALLLAGGMGAGSVVTVQQVKPATSKVRAAPVKPKVQKTVPRVRQTTSIQECPLIAPLGPGIDTLTPIQPPENIFTESPPGGGGVFGPKTNPNPFPVTPGIPQPDTWIMLVAGFGFLGLALRRRSNATNEAE